MNGLHAIAHPRKKALGYLGAFFAVIILLSMLATTLHTLSVAQVETAKPQRAALTRTLEAQGVAQAEVESLFFIHALYVQLGIFVDQVLVHDGQSVNVGDPIIKLNVDQLAKALEEAELELLTQQLIYAKGNITSATPNTSLDEEKAQRDAETAARNRHNALANADKAVLLAEEALAEAVLNLDKAQNHLMTVQSQSSAEGQAAYQQSVSSAQDKVNQASLALQQSQIAKSDALLLAQRRVDDCARNLNNAQAALALSPDDPALQASLLDAQIALDRANEDYNLALRDGDHQLDAATNALYKAQQEMNALQGQGMATTQQTLVDAAQAALEQAKKAVTARQRDVDDAIKAREEAIAKADDEIWLEGYGRQIMQEERRMQATQEAQIARQNDIDRQLREMELMGIEAEVDLLGDIVASDGVIFAAYSGVITRVEAQSGTPVPTIAVRFAQDQSGINFICRVAKSQAKYFVAGDPAIWKVQDEEDREVIIGEIRAVPEDEELADILIHLNADQMRIGGTAWLTAEKKTPVYDCVIPLGALRSDGGGHFVLVVRENTGGWGAKLYVQRVGVKVLAQDFKYAAVEGALQLGDACVTRSNKAISDGDSVQGMRQ